MTHNPDTRGAGFTLIEMLVTVAIIAILAGIAYPSYQTYVQSSRRSDAMVPLQQIMLAQENWRVSHTTYGSLANLGIAATSPEGYYTIAITSASGTGYTATATATGVQASDTACTPMTIVVANGGGTTTTTPSGCWKK